ncbi:MAG: DUF2911 domain-containing protein [Bacteroidota bacterium]
MTSKLLRPSILLTAFLSFWSIQTWAQLVLPQPSPRCGSRLAMGVTDLEVDFGSPAVNGRIIWGGLVPYDEIWRSGANAATWLSFSTEVSFGGQTVKAGKYALYMIPRAGKAWTVALNSNEGQWGSTSFKENLDIVRVEVSPSKAASFRERLAFDLEFINASSANLRLHWENMQLVIPISADSKTLGMNNVSKFFADRPDDWYPCANAAIFALEQGNDQAYALDLALKAVRLNGEHFYPRWALARVHAAKGEYREAAEQAEQARLKGEAENSDWYQVNAADIAARKAEWSAKATPVPTSGKKKGK